MDDEPRFVVEAAGEVFVFLSGDQVVIQEGLEQPWWRFEGREAPKHIATIAEATAQLVGRCLYLQRSGAPWFAVDEVVNVAAALDFAEELRRLRWRALGGPPRY
jgi:hypothetical protein